jgi:hypothetical protein
MERTAEGEAVRTSTLVAKTAILGMAAVHFLASTNEIY